MFSSWTVTYSSQYSVQLVWISQRYVEYEGISHFKIKTRLWYCFRKCTGSSKWCWIFYSCTKQKYPTVLCLWYFNKGTFMVKTWYIDSYKALCTIHKVCYRPQSFIGIFQQGNSRVNCRATFYELLWKTSQNLSFEIHELPNMVTAVSDPIEIQTWPQRTVGSQQTTPGVYLDGSKHQIHNAGNTH